MYFIPTSVLLITLKYEEHTTRLLESSKLNVLLPATRTIFSRAPNNFFSCHQGAEIIFYFILNSCNFIVKLINVGKFMSNHRPLVSLQI